ncbi:MAG: hypothetical protein J6V14_05935 [Clostridia bacterium]|nr:hypothetical protein [Clostridia bacterium]
MEEKSKETYIDIGKILLVLWDRVIWIVASTVILAALAYALTLITWKPVYTSEVQLYTVMESSDEKATEVTTSQINIRRNVAALYVKAIKKPDSLAKMAEQLKNEGYEVTEGSLSRLLDAYIDSDASEIIHVKAHTGDKKLSLRVCQLIGEEADDLVKDAYIGCTVAVFNNPREAVSPDSSHAMRNMVLGAAAGFILSCAVIIAIYLLDRSIKNGEDLEKLSGVRYLGEIPDINETFKGGDKYYSSYSHQSGERSGI